MSGSDLERRRMQRSRSALRAAVRSDLGRNTGWALVGEGARFASTALSFLLLARILGASSFGRYAGAYAFVSIFFPFASMGAGHLLVMQLAKERESFRTAWAAALIRAAVGGIVAIFVGVALQPLVLPRVGRDVIVLLAVAELVGASGLELAANAFQAQHRLRASSLIRASLAGTRLAALFLFATIGGARTVAGWVPWHLGASLVAAIGALLVVAQKLGWPDAQSLRKRPSLLTGIPFSFSLSAAYIQDDIDKALVLRYQPASEAGIYAAGYRFISVALVPLRSLLTAAYPRFFEAGAGGLASSTRFGRRLLPWGIAYGVGTGALCIALSPFVPVLLGPAYRESAAVLASLAFLPAVRVLQFLAGDVLTGAGHHSYRTVCQIGTCLLNVVLNVVLVPLYSWKGAAAATFASELALIVLLSLVIRLLLKRPAAVPPPHGRSGSGQDFRTGRECAKMPDTVRSDNHDDAG